MGLLPEGASFEEQVTDFFALVRGSGLMLSALDRELLSQWAVVGVPFEVVARGIRMAAEKAAFDARPGSSLRSLRACKREVEKEIRKHLDRSAGETTAGDTKNNSGVLEERSVRMAKTIRGLKRTQALAAAPLDRLLGWLERERERPQLEDRVFAALARALPFEQRVKATREARTLAQTQQAASARARKLSLRVHRAAVLRRALDLPAFW